MERGMTMEFRNQVVIVTGGAGGIGRAVAEAFCREGASVVIADINQESGEAWADEMAADGLSGTFYHIDLRDILAMERMVQWVTDEFGGVDILINNAGISQWTPLDQLTEMGWDHVLGVNLKAMVFMAKYCSHRMKKRGGGRIINIASTRHQMSEPDSEAYAASKGGIVSLTHALAISLSSEGIIVNAISPGWIETGDYNELRFIDHQQHPSGRVGKPDDIARLCLFLCRHENDFINGENIVIDGGMTKKMIYAL